MSSQFVPGARVRLRSDRKQEAVILEGPIDHSNGPEFNVLFRFRQGGPEWLQQSALEAFPNYSVREVSPRDLVRDLALAKLGRRLTDNLYSVGASRTLFKVHQFRPVLKFLRAWEEFGKRGILIADEVGLGKTIEAAIILQELKARTDVKRVLVLCPSRLTTKWQTELQSRFSEQFSILDSQKLRQWISDVRRDQDQSRFQYIGSFELLRRAEFMNLLPDLNITIDYLIVDEAHHLRNPSSKTNALGDRLASLSNAVALLSATPLQIGSEDLFHLLRLLAPEDYDEFGAFESLRHPNQFLTAAQRSIRGGESSEALRHLAKIEGHLEHNPLLLAVIKELRSTTHPLSPDQRVDLQRQLNDLNSFGAIMNRTRKRDFENDVAIREPHTVSIALNSEEQALYDGVWLATREAYRFSRNSGKGLGFVTVMRERQAASCLAATGVFLAETAKRKPNPLGIEQSEFGFSPNDGEDIDKATAGWKVTDVSRLQKMAGALKTDSKFDRLLEIVTTIQSEQDQPRILLFSYFRHTLDHLYSELRKHGIKVGIIHGGVNPLVRNERINEFRQGGSFRIMLSSEVGAEGLDFEFCDVLVNYDLPWNPMQVEQRIGRLDRFGRTSGQKIRIYNFVIEGTIEERILGRLYDRIRIFEQSIGDLGGILGETIKELSEIALSPDLTPQQQEQKARETADRLINNQKEIFNLSQQEDQLLGNNGLLDNRVNDAINQGHIVTPAELYILLTTYLGDKFPTLEMNREDDDFYHASLVVNRDLGRELDDFSERTKLRLGDNSALARARAEHGRVPLSFDPQRADTRAPSEFINVHHPLIRLAVDHWQKKQSASSSHALPMTELALYGTPGEAGNAWFMIYVVRVSAVRQREFLEVVVLRESDGSPLPGLENRLLKEIQSNLDLSVSAKPSDLSDAVIWIDRALERWS